MWVEGFFFCFQCTKFNGRYICSLGWEQMPFMNRLSGGISWFMFSSQLSPGFFHSVPLLAINGKHWKSKNEGKFMNYTQSQSLLVLRARSLGRHWRKSFEQFPNFQMCSPCLYLIQFLIWCINYLSGLPLFC